MANGRIDNSQFSICSPRSLAPLAPLAPLESLRLDKGSGSENKKLCVELRHI